MPKPDLVLYFKNEVEDLMKRHGFGEEVYEKKDFQKKVKEIYEQHLCEEDWMIINGEQDVDNIASEIFLKVKDFILQKFGYLFDKSNNQKEPIIQKLFTD